MTIFWLSIMKNTGLIFLIIKYLMYINEKMFAALDFFFIKPMWIQNHHWFLEFIIPQLAPI